MIVFDRVAKTYHGHGYDNHVFRDLSFVLNRGESLGVLGANGVGKSTLMRLISGVERPTAGKITRAMSVSWPLGYSPGFQTSLTGADNARFIARIYGHETRGLIDQVNDFAQLGEYMDQPVKVYSAGMSARLAFGLSLAIEFDCYLIDEITSAGDERFRERTDDALKARRKSGAIVLVSHDREALFRYCTQGAVLYGGTLTLFDTIEEAVDVHYRLQKLPSERQ